MPEHVWPGEEIDTIYTINGCLIHCIPWIQCAKTLQLDKVYVFTFL